MPNNFWDRLKRLYAPTGPSVQQPAQTQPATPPSYQQQAPQPQTEQHGPLDLQGKINMIHEAGRQLRMLEIKYDGVSRLVEPYSFRQGSKGLLFFGYCSIHDRTHSFKPEKIEDIKISEFPFSPRWEVEL